MREHELEVAAMFSDRLPVIAKWDGDPGWTVCLTPGSPVDNFAVLQTARGKTRYFRTIDSAVRVCRKYGLGCHVLLPGTEAVRNFAYRAKKELSK